MWTVERTERAVALWNKGTSAGVIAHELGGVTRNAVIGKMLRLGLRRAGDKTVKRKTYASNHRVKPRVNNFDRRVMRCDLTPLPLPADEPPGKPLVTFDGLEPHHCRAPYGDPKQPGFGFCGCEKVPGKSYCAAHLARFTMAVRVCLAPGPKPRTEEPAFAPHKPSEIDEVLA